MLADNIILFTYIQFTYEEAGKDSYSFAAILGDLFSIFSKNKMSIYLTRILKFRENKERAELK